MSYPRATFDPGGEIRRRQQARLAAPQQQLTQSNNNINPPLPVTGLADLSI